MLSFVVFVVSVMFPVLYFFLSCRLQVCSYFASGAFHELVRVCGRLYLPNHRRCRDIWGGVLPAILLLALRYGTARAFGCLLKNVVPTAGLCLGCFIAALPSGICPMPFTLSCLSIFMFYFGIYQTRFIAFFVVLDA